MLNKKREQGIIGVSIEKEKIFKTTAVANEIRNELKNDNWDQSVTRQLNWKQQQKKKNPGWSKYSRVEGNEE